MEGFKYKQKKWTEYNFPMKVPQMWQTIKAYAVSAAMCVSSICNLFSSNICGLEAASDSSLPVVLQFRGHLKKSHSSVHPVSWRPQ